MADGKKKKPALTGRDKELWQKVTETVTPLDERPATAEIKPRKMVRRLENSEPLPENWHKHADTNPNPFVEKRTQRKIATGTMDVDRSLDLHGLNQEQAFLTLRSAIEGGIRRGDKVLLVVTGKGGKRFSQTAPDTPVAYRTRDDFDQDTGVLKNKIPSWLNGAELRPFVESFGPAAKPHGGDGAMYILLRKRFSRGKKT